MPASPRRITTCQGGASCVVVTYSAVTDSFLITGSKDPARPELEFTPSEWKDFVTAAEHAMRVHISRAFRIQPYLLGVHMRCACHPAPRPYGSEYARRRRTRHRRR